MSTPMTDATGQEMLELMRQMLRSGGTMGGSGGSTSSIPGIGLPSSTTDASLLRLIKPEYLEGLDKTKSDLKSITDGFDKFFEGVGEVDRILDETSKPLRATLFDIQTTFGGFRRATEEMTIGVSQNIREEYDTFAETFTMTANELKEASKEKYILSVDGAEINVLTDVFENANEYSSKFRSFIEEYASTTGPKLAEGLKKSGSDIALFNKNFGLSIQELGSFINKEVAQTGQATTTMLDDLKKFSYGLSSQTGISAKLIAKDTVSIVSNVERFGNVTVEQAARMSTALKQLGVSYTELDKMIGQFQSFDTAAQKVGELSAVFGIHLDAVEMMTLANTDQEAMMFKLKDAFDASGQSLDDMNIAQKNLLTQQAGFSDVKQMEMFFSGQVDSLEELKEMTDEAATDESAADAVAAFNQDLATLALQGQTAAQRVDKAKNDLVYSMQSLAPEIMDFRSSVQTSISAMGGEVNQAVTQIANSVDGMKKGIASAASGEGFDKLGENMSEGFGKAGEKIVRGFSDVFLVHLPGIWEKSHFWASSPSKAGLNFAKGIVDSFPLVIDGFEKSLIEMNNKSVEYSKTINKNISSLGIDGIEEKANTTATIANTNITEILNNYQKKLEDIQGIVDAPDKIVEILTSVADMKKAIEELIQGLKESSQQPISISFDSKGEAEKVLINVLKNYVGTDTGRVVFDFDK